MNCYPSILSNVENRSLPLKKDAIQGLPTTYVCLQHRCWPCSRQKGVSTSCLVLVKNFRDVNSFDSCNVPIRSEEGYRHFTDEKTEVEKSWVACPRSHLPIWPNSRAHMDSLKWMASPANRQGARHWTEVTVQIRCQNGGMDTGLLLLREDFVRYSVLLVGESTYWKIFLTLNRNRPF